MRPLLILIALQSIYQICQSGNFPELTADDVQKAFSSGNSLVMFYAPHCGACHRFMSETSELADLLQDMGNIKFGKINGEKYDKLADDAKIDGWPTVVLYNGDKEVSRFDNDKVDMTAKNVANWLKKYIE